MTRYYSIEDVNLDRARWEIRHLRRAVSLLLASLLIALVTVVALWVDRPEPVAPVQPAPTILTCPEGTIFYEGTCRPLMPTP